MSTFSFLIALKFIGIAIVALTAAGFLVMMLWNWLVPQLFKGPVIKFKHALGLMLLSFLLFGGFRGRGHWGGRHCYGGQHPACQEQCPSPEKNGN